MSERNPFDHAIVLGSGVAGLISAIVLSESFKRVTIFEKDAEPRGPGFRNGIPQGRHFHALIPGGLEIMEELLPGVKKELRELGSVLPEPHQFYTYRPEGKSYAIDRWVPVPPKVEGLEPAYMQTRGLLEHTIRTRVMSLSNVEANYNATVKNLLVADDKVIGIIVEETGEEVQADLVIDSLGKAGRTLYWLDKMGFDRPEENVVDCDFAYTSVFMKPNNPDVFTDVGFFVAPDINADHRRIAALVTMEDGLWITLVGGRYGDYPPRDMAGFLEYAETLIDPTFRDLLAQAEPVGEPAHFRFPKGIRRRFDKLENFPDGLLPIGDSFCHFNPAYGQGMTSACRQAMGLRRVLQDTITSGEGLDGIWRNLFPISYQETRAPWLFACLADFMHPKCTGDFPEEEMEIFSVYQFVVELAFKGDREALGTFLDIANLKAPLQSLEKSKWPDVYAESIAAKESTN